MTNDTLRGNSYRERCNYYQIIFVEGFLISQVAFLTRHPKGCFSFIIFLQLWLWPFEPNIFTDLWFDVYVWILVFSLPAGHQISFCLSENYSSFFVRDLNSTKGFWNSVFSALSEKYWQKAVHWNKEHICRFVWRKKIGATQTLKREICT